MRGFFMTSNRRWIWVMAVICWFGQAVNAEEPAAELKLPFWEIGLADFTAEKPRAVAMPDLSGRVGHYWYWTFKFKAVSTLEKLNAFLKEVTPTLEGEQKAFYESYQGLLDQALAQPLKVNPYVVLHADTGEIITDTGNPLVLKAVAAKLGHNIQSVKDLAGQELKPGETYEAAAVFPRLNPLARDFEIRVYGLGSRVAPRYQPGRLLYEQNRFRPSLRRALRFQYRRVGGSAEDYLDPVLSGDQQSDWVWIWPAQIFVGRARELNVERQVDEATLGRNYWGVPFKIFNDTSEAQSLVMRSAGLHFDLEWQGEKLALDLADDGGELDYWGGQALAQLKAQSGDAGAEFVRQHEAAPEGGDAARRDADIAAKALLLAEDQKGRFPASPVAAGKLARGVMLLRRDALDLKPVLARLINDLRSRALARKAEGEAAGGELFKAYQELRAGNPQVEPAEAEVVKLILTRAEEDLKARQAELSEKDRLNYGELAPLGRLLELLCAERLAARAEKGFVDAVFDVKWDGVIDRCAFPCHFQRFLPTERDIFVEPDIDVGMDAAQMMRLLKKEKKKAEEEAAEGEKPAEGEEKKADTEEKKADAEEKKKEE